jgi:hypothetical protein
MQTKSCRSLLRHIEGKSDLLCLNNSIISGISFLISKLVVFLPGKDSPLLLE